MKSLHRTRDRVEVPAASARVISADFRLALITGGLALLCLIVTGSSGGLHARELHSRLLAAGGAVLFLVLTGLTIRSTANETLRVLTPRVGPAHASIIRRAIIFGGAVIALLVTLGLLAVPIQRLLVGGALTGVILGIAGQQALGNVFAGLVLLLARPFNIGDAIRVRSGALGGEFTGRVTGMGVTYVTIDTPDGLLSVPNSALLAAGIGPTTRTAAPTGSAQSSPSAPEPPAIEHCARQTGAHE